MKRSNHGVFVPADRLTDEALERARRALCPIATSKLDDVERAELRAELARAVLGELTSAYAEQTSRLLRQHSRAPNYRLSRDDITFAHRWADTLRFEADRRRWEADPDNLSAARLAEACMHPEQLKALPDDTKRRLDDRPRSPATTVTLADAPRGWPRQVTSWSQAVEDILRSRREMAGVREPIDSDVESNSNAGGDHAGDEPIGNIVPVGKSPGDNRQRDSLAGPPVAENAGAPHHRAEVTP